MIWFLSLFNREFEQRHALLIIFLASSFWGVLWVPMRHIEAMGLSGFWICERTYVRAESLNDQCRVYYSLGVQNQQ